MASLFNRFLNFICHYNMICLGSVLIFSIFGQIFPQDLGDLNRIDSRSYRNDRLEGSIRLIGGRTLFEGNIEINHFDQWGNVCDDEWDINDADVVCRQLGFVLGAMMATTNSRYGLIKKSIWMDNVQCNGSENALDHCMFDGWGFNDCGSNEAAGVICRLHKNQIPNRHIDGNSTKKIKPIMNVPENTSMYSLYGKNIPIRLMQQKSKRKNFVQVFVENEWKFICADGFGMHEAHVMCQMLNLGSVEAISIDSSPKNQSILSGLQCGDRMKTISECQMILKDFCPDDNIVSITCLQDLPDLVPNATEIEQSAFVEDRSIMFLQCAMEENCLSQSAYEIDKKDPTWIFEKRTLLRFTASVKNIGKIDFRPFREKTNWIWHTCHRHYHSMEVFASFDILDNYGERVAQGHKASFCLEDNECHSNQQGKFACANFGDQGISTNCVDIYKYDLDCQWIDITDINFGFYYLKIIINPEMKVPELTFENNAVTCSFNYKPKRSTVTNCTLAPI